MRILIVEDDEVIATTMCRGLTLHGYVVDHAASAEAAATVLLSERFDLAIIDLGLPQEDGTSLVRRIRRSNRTLPVVVVTARDSIADRVDTLDLGADDYLVKPVSREAFLSAIRRLAGLQPGRVLIIDDDEKDRYLLRHRLRGTPVEITEAANGPDGIAMALLDHPDLIFLDLAMEGMNGFEVLSALKEDPRTQTTPVVIHTSGRLSAEERNRLSSNAAAIVFKDELTSEEGLVQLARKLGSSGRMLTKSA